MLNQKEALRNRALRHLNRDLINRVHAYLYLVVTLISCLYGLIYTCESAFKLLLFIVEYVQRWVLNDYLFYIFCISSRAAETIKW